jgi:hypothetical protein
MSCSTSEARLQRQVSDQARRITKLEAELRGFQEWTGICTSAANTIVALYTSEWDPGTGIFTITFASQEGQQFQIQQSSDGGVTWTIADNVVLAEVSPAIVTEWDSTAFTIDDLPIIFRVRLYPRALLPCPPAEAGPCPILVTPVIT